MIFLIIFLLIIIISLKFSWSSIMFSKNGYYLEKELISKNDCQKLIKIINNELKNPKKEEGNIRDNKNRKDLLLPVNSDIKNIIEKIKKRFKNLIENSLENPVLAECSSFLSYPNSTAQGWHKDVEHIRNTDQGNLITFAVSLVDIDDSMGPLEIIPKSHKINNNDLREYGSIEELFSFKNTNPKKMSCPIGSVIIWDAKTIHRGGKNNSSKIRPMFYFSLLEGNKKRPKGPTFSLKSDSISATT